MRSHIHDLVLVASGDGKHDGHKKRRRCRQVSIQALILYVTVWLQTYFGVKQLRDIGITTSTIKKESQSAIKLLQDGEDEVRIEFNPNKSKKSSSATVVASVTDIIKIQELGTSSPKGRLACQHLVTSSIERQHNAAQRDTREESQSHYLRLDSIIKNNENCFVLPFRTEDKSLLSADSLSTEFMSRRCPGGNRRYSDSDLNKYFENSINDALLNRSHIMYGYDLMALQPGECLNDQIINFFLKWLTVPRYPGDSTSNVHVFSSYFLSQVISEGYSTALQRWVATVNIFQKKLLIIPVHYAHHWSLVLVYNPGKVKQTLLKYHDVNYTREVTGLVFLDSLHPNSPHDKLKIANAVRLVLNKEWARFHTNLEVTDLPFNNRRCLKLISPIGKCCYLFPAEINIEIS